MGAGDFAYRITIQRFDKDIGTWVDEAKVWANIRPLSAKEVIDRGDVQQNATHLFTIRYSKRIKSTMRILFGGRIYDIQQILPHFQKRDRLEMTCEELHEMNDTVSVVRSEKVKNDRNVITSVPIPPRDVSCCIIEIQHGHNQNANDPVKWEKKAIIDFELDSNVREGDTISLPNLGDFFVVQARPAKHFLSVVAVQEKRGAES